MQFMELSVVREGGLEPPRPLRHQDLNLARLPITPLARHGHNTSRLVGNRFEVVTMPTGPCRGLTVAVGAQEAHILGAGIVRPPVDMVDVEDQCSAMPNRFDPAFLALVGTAGFE